MNSDECKVGRNGRDWEESEKTNKIRARIFKRKGGKGKLQWQKEVQRKDCVYHAMKQGWDETSKSWMYEQENNTEK